MGKKYLSYLYQLPWFASLSSLAICYLNENFVFILLKRDELLFKFLT